MHYILVDKKPVKITDLRVWKLFYLDKSRFIEQTMIGKYKISTVFLGVDHNFGDGEPLLFETMVFDTSFNFKSLDEFSERYSSYEEAETGHKKIVELIKRMVTK